jgi:hypothetical protein
MKLAKAALLLTAFFMLSLAGDSQAQSIEDRNPDTRALAVELAAKANTRVSAQTVMAAVAVESDGPAGFKMAEHVALLTSNEALDVVERAVMGFNKPENLFGAYWTFLGLLRQNSERSNEIVRKAITDTRDRDFYLRAAAIEALAVTGSTRHADLLLTTLRGLDQRRMETEHLILTLSCIHGAPKLVRGIEAELRNNIVLALADLLEKTSDDRIQWFLCTALAEITGEEKYIDPEFWRWWVRSGGVKTEHAKEGHSVAGRDIPRFFEAAAVGKRVVFAIDISGSMQHPVNLPPEMRRPPETPTPERRRPTTGRGAERDQAEEREIPPPDYSKVRTKLDLAKVELIHTLRHLPEDYYFNIVLYHTPHSMIDSSKNEFVRATEANKQLFIRKVEDLHWAQLTNIHGALVRSFGINMRRSIDPMRIGRRDNNPAWDPECMVSGATTIFFLTDGSPTISDDSTDTGTVGRAGGPPRGNGRMVQPANIVTDVRRMNTFRKVVINTVGIGPHHQGLMRALAEMSGGEYIDRTGVASNSND